MLSAVLLIINILCVPVQQGSRKVYNLKVINGAYSFTAISAAIAMIVFLISSDKTLIFMKETFVYSLIYAFAYIITSVTTIISIAIGPLSVTTLIISYALIIPTFYGIMFLNETVSSFLTIGIILLLISIALVNLEKKSKEKIITPKWIAYVFVAFLSNGACSVVQKMQQTVSGGLYKNEFMLMGLMIVVICCLLLGVLKEKKQITNNIKKGLVPTLLCGLFNGISNLTVLILANKMPASVMFPIISAGSIIATAFASIIFYKENLSFQQKTGMFIGTLAIILLNL